MTSRELLRDTACRLDYAATIPHVDLDVAVEHRARAAALRALADRLDAEEQVARQKANESMLASNVQALAAWHMVQGVIERLDAPSGRVMPGKETT